MESMHSYNGLDKNHVIYLKLCGSTLTLGGSPCIFLLPSACICTLTKSNGLANN